MELSMRSRLGLALGVVVVVSVMAQAAMMVVEQDESTEQVRAERFNLTSPLHVSESHIDVIPGEAQPQGTAADPVELAADEPRAHTQLSQDNWMYTVVLEEETAAAYEAGHLRVDLLVSGGGMENENVGSVYIGQTDPDEEETEGARLSWDLGSELPSNPLFVLKTHPHTPTGQTRDITLESDYDATQGGYVWKGVGGEIDGQTNPDLSVEAGTTVTFTIRHGCASGDTAPHNFALEDSSGTRVVESEDVTDCGDEDTVTWTAPDQAASYDYQCDYHPDSMLGTLEVTSEDGGGDDGGSSILPEQPPSATVDSPSADVDAPSPDVRSPSTDGDQPASPRAPPTSA